LSLPSTVYHPLYDQPLGDPNKDATTEEFFADLRAMCSLIDEADRYGTTVSMEEEYRRLRSSLASGFRSVASRYPAVRAGGGFHGCGFEMILASHNLDALVRNSGRRAVERLTEVWRAVSAACSGV
jgi:hypothetical protein